MENMDKKEGMGGCGCHGGKCHLVKIILKIIIVILIFWSGFKLGVITGAIREEYGRGGYGGGMMRGYYNNPPVNGTIPAPAQ
jgi:hypothetical protein